MAKIQIEEPQPASVTATHTLLRMALGGIVLLEATQQALHYGAWRDRVAQLHLGDPRVDTAWLARSALLVAALFGGCLVLGLLTRLSTLFTIGVAVELLSTLHFDASTWFDARFELACLVIACAAYLFATGPSELSLDTRLRRRARRRAIERDAIWNSPPYNMPPGSSRPR